MSKSIITQRIATLFDNDKSKKQKELAKKIGISESTLSTWLSKGRDIPPEYLLPICEFWNISLIWLLTGEKICEKELMNSNEQEWLNLYYELSKDSEDNIKECIGFVKGYIARGISQTTK